jgi:hypothetical protein
MDPCVFAFFEHLEETAVGIVRLEDGDVEVLRRESDDGSRLFISNSMWTSYEREKRRRKSLKAG